MTRLALLCCLLVLTMLFLNACSQPRTFELASLPTQNTGVSQNESTDLEPETETNPAADTAEDIDYTSYDPASEEGVGSTLSGETTQITDLSALLDMEKNATVYSEPTEVPAEVNSYAGATPVIIDPIDKPTPTPVPALTFGEYVVYDATKLGLSFEAPVGWTVNDIEQSVYTITNPDSSVDYQATVKVSAYSVNSEYSQSELSKEVRNVLNTLKGGFASFSPTNTATRTLLDKTGVYADFTAAYRSGVRVAGRVHAVCVNKKLYILEMTYPREYMETYKDTVYKRFRHSVKITK